MVMVIKMASAVCETEEEVKAEVKPESEDINLKKMFMASKDYNAIAKQIKETANHDIKKRLNIGFIDEDDILKPLLSSINLKHNICLRGATGTGKTYLIKELARALNKKLIILNMTTNTTIEEIKGKWLITGKLETGSSGSSQIKWLNGAVTDALQNGYWLLIEESNFMNEDLASVMYSVLDDRKQIILDEKEREEINAHEDFRVFLTMNYGYKGTTKLNDAMQNRINAFFDINYLSAKNEAKLLNARTGISLEIASKVVAFANAVRTISAEENLADLSTRILIKWCEFIVSGYSVYKSAEYTIIPLLAYSREDKKKIIDLLKLSFGEAQ